MTTKEEIAYQLNTEDFNEMRKMISDIEIALIQLKPIEQFKIYIPLMNVIQGAWVDICKK